MIDQIDQIEKSINSIKEMQDKMLKILIDKERSQIETKSNIALWLSIIALFFSLVSKIGG